MAETIRLYQPGSGSEGEGFYARFCNQCARDLPSNGTKDFDACEPHEICPIIALTLAWKITDPAYPKEWRYVDDKPTCTAFMPMGQPIPTASELEAAGQERLPL